MRKFMKNIIKEMEKKDRARIKRAKILAQVIGSRLNLSQDDIDRAVRQEYEALRKLNSESLISEFVDYEVVVFRALAKILTD